MFFQYDATFPQKMSIFVVYQTRPKYFKIITLVFLCALIKKCGLAFREEIPLFQAEMGTFIFVKFFPEKSINFL